MRTPLLGLLAAAVLSACGTVPPSPAASTTTLAALIFPLPTVGAADGSCLGVAIVDATLTGKPSDPRVAWLTSPTGRHDVVFPPGFQARFTPKLEVLNAGGDVVARDGTTVSGGCITGPEPNAPLLILSQ
jgi:hypothetical protein